MKIIGTTKIPSPHGFGSGEDGYVCVITRDELAKVADKARYSNKDERPDPKIGDDYAIAEGHDFRAQLLDATRKMAEAYAAFAKVAPVAAEWAGVVARKTAETQP